MLNKITRNPFKKVERTSNIFYLIHSDLCDFRSTPSLGNKRYMITYIDDYSRFRYVFLLHSKVEALSMFKIFKNEVEVQLDSKIKRLRTDKGGECYNPSYFQEIGIVHETTAGYSPQSNGVAKRKNRTLQEMVNSMLSYLGLSEGFWGEVMLIACHILNRVPTRGKKAIPYELW